MPAGAGGESSANINEQILRLMQSLGIDPTRTKEVGTREGNWARLTHYVNVRLMGSNMFCLSLSHAYRRRARKFRATRIKTEEITYF